MRSAYATPAAAMAVASVPIVVFTASPANAGPGLCTDIQRCMNCIRTQSYGNCADPPSDTPQQACQQSAVSGRSDIVLVDNPRCLNDQLIPGEEAPAPPRNPPPSTPPAVPIAPGQAPQGPQGPEDPYAHEPWMPGQRSHDN